MTNILSADKVKLGVNASNKEEAIRIAGQLLVDAGHVDAAYIEKMLEREAALSTFMGNGIAIPHGTNESKALVKSTGLSIVQIPNGVDFGDGNVANLLIGIAAAGNEHVEILTNIAMIISEDENVEQILKAQSADEIIEIFEKGL
ncbi:PTS sugar transporter subunit IIA [Tumebacillus flagellatus]|uniref:Mannitol-specific phosphotransferase enzyme IIA component n=1 Tax=Tumebacillus flagellatus TaxID=1157490 RepID=A0A074MEB4_9BACL|nr:PTS sugar transporter subunit IIA [Tumebacillus flagellatus]KEO84127.1 PTS mannitol transporter subunit IIA [Tumebacillus flagellatus]